MFAKTVLDNGIRVVSNEMPDHRSVSLGIWVENGSRHESAPQNGISHFIEHLLFKGTERRSAAQIAEEMDAVGGVLNAFTSKEQTCYYAKVLDENLPLAIDLLTDIFLHSSFDAEEIERERSVILQEMSQSEDTPDDYVHDLFSLDFFKDHPIGRPICGRQETVNRFQRRDFVNFFQNSLPPEPRNRRRGGKLSPRSSGRGDDGALGYGRRRQRTDRGAPRWASASRRWRAASIPIPKNSSRLISAWACRVSPRPTRGAIRLMC